MRLQRTIAATFLAGLLAAVAATPAEARDNHRGRHDRDDRDGRRHAAHRVVRVRPVVVPSRIAFRDARRFNPYFDTRVWHGRHRHHHAVYNFPVAVRPGRVVYAPHTYCDGRLIVRGDVYLGDGYDDRYRWDDRVSGYVTIGAPNFRIGVGF